MSCPRASGRLTTTAVLAAFFFCLLGLNGCSKLSGGDKGSLGLTSEFFEEMRANIQSSVSDPVRVNKMLAIVDQVEREALDLDEEVRAFYKNYETVDSNYETTRQEFEAVFSDFEKSVAEHRERFLVSMLELKTHATREEWAAITDRDHTLYDSWRRRYEI